VHRAPALHVVDPDTIHHLSEPTLTLAGNTRDATIFKGKTLSLLHPVMMVSLLAFSVNTALKGFAWRRQRTIGDDISALKKTMPKVEAEAGEEVTADPALLALQSEIDGLTAERKQLASEGPRDKHFSQGAMLAFLGTTFAIEVRKDDMI